MAILYTLTKTLFTDDNYENHYQVLVTIATCMHMCIQLMSVIVYYMHKICIALQINNVI